MVRARGAVLASWRPRSILDLRMPNAFPSLALHCLGPPSVRVDGHEAPPDVLWRKHLALLTYLALSPDGRRSRNHLLGLLWPESPDDKARRSLNEAVRTASAPAASCCGTP